MQRKFPLILAALLAAACSPSGKGGPSADAGGVPFYQMHTELLPDLNFPRGSGVLLQTGEQEFTVFAGHTDGFIPLANAEYFKDGAWHVLRSVYSHDLGFVSLLPDGRVMLGGGAGESFGIGQSWGVEVYDPSDRSFRPVGILDRKRCFPSALALPDGSLIVSGNWYADDSVESGGADGGFTRVMDVSEARSCPYILRSGRDGYIIFGGSGNHGEPAGCMVDVSGGEPRREAILEEWSVTRDASLPSADAFRIGESDYLLPAKDRRDGSCGIIRVERGHFSVVETAIPIPQFSPDSSAITWWDALQADRQSRTAWLYGIDRRARIILAEIGYDPVYEGREASVRMWMADNPDTSFIPDLPLLLGDGRFLFAGGLKYDGEGITNFVTGRKAFIVSVHPAEKGAGWILWASAGALLVLAVIAALSLVRRRKAGAEPGGEVAAEKDSGPKNDLMSRIIRLMEEDGLYRSKGLTKADVARALGTNVSYVSACINAQHGTTFPEFVAGYRVDHARRLMREHPGMPLSEVGEESGFASEQSFFRTFKALTGKTPMEWKNSPG